MECERCPFKAGDQVVYTPSDRGHALDVMSNQRLERGRTYVVGEIKHGAYVVVRGHDHPGGGIYWTEFSPLATAD